MDLPRRLQGSKRVRHQTFDRVALPGPTIFGIKGDSMDAADTARAITPPTPKPRLVMVVDERESPWVVDVASGRVVRRNALAVSAETAAGERAAS